MNNKGLACASIGGILALLCACLSFYIAFQWVKFGKFPPPRDPAMYEALMQAPLEPRDFLRFLPAVLSAIGGILSFFSCRFRDTRRAAIVLQLSAMLCIFSLFGIIPMILLTIGAYQTTRQTATCCADYLDTLDDPESRDDPGGKY